MFPGYWSSASLSYFFTCVSICSMTQSWAWFCLYYWSAGGIIRVKFSIKMLPDVLLIAKANILPALGKTGSSCAVKALEAQRTGGERS